MLEFGLPPESPEERLNFSRSCSLRCLFQYILKMELFMVIRALVWKILLGAVRYDSQNYCDLVEVLIHSLASPSLHLS